MYLAFDQMDTIPDGCRPDPRNEALLIWKSAYEDMKKLLRPGSRESPHHKQSYKMVIGGALEYFVKRLKSKEMIEEADDLLKWVEMEEAAEDEEEAEKDAPLLVEARKSAESLSEIFHKPLEGTDEDFLARWPACNMYQRVLRAGDDVQPDQLETFKADLEELYNTMIQEHIDSLQQLAETQGEGKDKEEIISILKKHYHPFFTYPTDNDILKATGFIVPPKRPSSPIHNYFLRHKRSKIKS